MSLSRLVFTWLGLVLWFLLWETVSRRVRQAAARPSLATYLRLHAGEALLFTLLGALWFGSLGSGGWWLVFALVGALREWPRAAAERRPRRGDWREPLARGLGVARAVAAGGWMAWKLGPA